MMHKGHPPAASLGELRPRVDARLAAWKKDRFWERLRAKDPTLWPSGAPGEIRARLGWLDLPESMRIRLDGIGAFSSEVRAEGFARIVLLGMGGSSLAPEVFQKTFGNAPGFPELTVLDSTHPEAVTDVERKLDLSRTLFLVSSKSGTTVEPLSLFRYFWSRAASLTKTPGRNFAAVTDPDTPLAELARKREFRRVFTANPEVGGRYSALTEFGLVPAALIGVDIKTLLDRAREAEAENVVSEDGGLGAELILGAVLGETARERDKLTLSTSPALESFPDWIEQLVAESTGKDGKGIIPIAGEPAVPSGLYGRDRIFVHIALATDGPHEDEGRLDDLEQAGHPVVRILLSDVYDLGRQIYQWEIAVAAACSVLGVNPFDQPDVELAKELAREAMAGGTPADEDAGEGTLRRTDRGSGETVPASDLRALARSLESWMSSAREGDYLALQAFLPPGEELTRALQDLRLAFLKKTRLATTFGYGPRFLHSTGQLHKGGANDALVLQLVDSPGTGIEVPESDYSFDSLIRAQSLGDFVALRRKGRRVLRVDCDAGLKESAAGIRNLVEA